MDDKLFWEGVAGDNHPAFSEGFCIGVGQTEKEARVLVEEYESTKHSLLDSFSYNRALAELSMFIATEKFTMGSWAVVNVNKLMAYCWNRRINP